MWERKRGCGEEYAVLEGEGLTREAVLFLVGFTL